MRDVYRQVVFAVGKSEFTWSDVVLAAALRGEWEPVCNRAIRGALAVARAQETDDPALSDDDIESASNEFRYDRDLVTAEETEAWLDRWDLDADAWTSWIAADLLVRRGEEAGAGEIAPEDVESAVHAEAVCSDALGRFAYRLAARAAIAARIGGEAAEPASGISADEPDADLPVPPHLPFSLSPDEARSRLRELARLERAHGALREEVVGPESLEGRVRAHQTDWLRVAVRMLRLPSEDVAREALLSIRDDESSLEEVANDAGGEVRAGVFYLEELEPAVRDHLVAARRGELLGPLAASDGCLLILVEDKILPSTSDPEIAEKAAASLLESVESREIDNHVSWRWKK